MDRNKISSRLHPYEPVVDRVLEQFELSPEEMVEVKIRIIEDNPPCPWFSRNAYAQANSAAASFVSRRNAGA